MTHTTWGKIETDKYTTYQYLYRSTFLFILHRFLCSVFKTNHSNLDTHKELFLGLVKRSIGLDDNERIDQLQRKMAELNLQMAECIQEVTF